MNRRSFLSIAVAVAMVPVSIFELGGHKDTCFLPVTGDGDAMSGVCNHWFDSSRWSNGVPRAGDTLRLTPASTREYRVVRPMPRLLLESDSTTVLRNID